MKKAIQLHLTFGSKRSSSLKLENYPSEGWWLFWAYELKGLKILVSVVRFRPREPLSQ